MIYTPAPNSLSELTPQIPNGPTRYSFISADEDTSCNSAEVTGRFNGTLPNLICHMRRKMTLESSDGLEFPFFLKYKNADEQVYRSPKIYLRPITKP